MKLNKITILSFLGILLVGGSILSMKRKAKEPVEPEEIKKVKTVSEERGFPQYPSPLELAAKKLNIKPENMADLPAEVIEKIVLSAQTLGDALELRKAFDATSKFYRAFMNDPVTWNNLYKQFIASKLGPITNNYKTDLQLILDNRDVSLPLAEDEESLKQIRNLQKDVFTKIINTIDIATALKEFQIRARFLASLEKELTLKELIDKIFTEFNQTNYQQQLLSDREQVLDEFIGVITKKLFSKNMPSQLKGQIYFKVLQKLFDKDSFVMKDNDLFDELYGYSIDGNLDSSDIENIEENQKKQFLILYVLTAMINASESNQLYSYLSKQLEKYLPNNEDEEYVLFKRAIDNQNKKLFDSLLSKIKPNKSLDDLISEIEKELEEDASLFHFSDEERKTLNSMADELEELLPEDDEERDD